MSDNQETKNTIFKDEEALLLDHDYDGIQELDHPLPFWWLAILYGTIVFSIGYGIYIHGMSGNSLNDEFNAAMAEVKAKQPAPPAAGSMDPAALAAVMKDSTKIALGKEVYVKNCVPCHGDAGQGLIGPNLTDDHWINGDGSPATVVNTLVVGVAEKGMPPWGPVLKEDELLGVAAYVRTLHGTNPPNPKEPQGPKYEFQEI